MAAFAKLNDYWENLLARFAVSSENEHIDRMANIWNQYQCMVTFNMSRSASYYESGTGRGMGFRDSCQDLLGFVHLIPERARERIIDIASTQFPDGSAYHIGWAAADVIGYGWYFLRKKALLPSPAFSYSC